MGLLEDDADPAPAQLGQLAPAQSGGGGAVDGDGAGVRRDQGGGDGQEAGLAGAGGPDHGGQAAPGHLQADPVQGGQPGVAVGIGERDVAQAQAHRALPRAVSGSTEVMRRTDSAAPRTPSTTVTAAGARTVPGERTKGTAPPTTRAPRAAAVPVPSRVPPTSRTTAWPSASLSRAGGGAQGLQHGDIGAALDGPHGEEGADDQRGDGEQEAAHQLEGAALGGVGADRGQRVGEGDGPGPGPPVDGREVGAGGGQGEDGGGRAAPLAGGRRGPAPDVEAGPDDRGVAEEGVAPDRGDRQPPSGEGEGVAGRHAESVGGPGGEHHRTVVEPHAVRGEAGAGPDTEGRDPGAPVPGGGLGGADPERFGALDTGGPGPLPPLGLGDGGIGVRQTLAAGGGLEGDLGGGQSRDRRDVLPAQSGRQPGQQPDQQGDQYDDGSHQGEAPLGEPQISPGDEHGLGCPSGGESGALTVAAAPPCARPAQDGTSRAGRRRPGCTFRQRPAVRWLP